MSNFECNIFSANVKNKLNYQLFWVYKERKWKSVREEKNVRKYLILKGSFQSEAFGETGNVWKAASNLHTKIYLLSRMLLSLVIC